MHAGQMGSRNASTQGCSEAITDCISEEVLGSPTAAECAGQGRKMSTQNTIHKHHQPVLMVANCSTQTVLLQRLGALGCLCYIRTSFLEKTEGRTAL